MRAIGRLAGLLCASLPIASVAAEPVVALQSGRLVYAADDRGNRVPDFSPCGYAGGDREPPEVAARSIVMPADGDDGARIQTAIDSVSARPPGADGFRGVVLLGPGEFEIADQLKIRASGVVLRGTGATEGGTTLVATGRSRRTLIQIAGVDNRRINDRSRQATAAYTPVGADQIVVDSAEGLVAGARVLVTRPSTEAWIKAIGADAFGVGWRPGSRDLRWDRAIIAVNGNAVTLDAPITTALDRQFGGGAVQSYDWPGRIDHVGLEDIRIVSQFDNDNPHDEEHAWFGVTLENVRDAWIRRVAFHHFAGGAVAAWEGASRLTVADCVSLDPVSENAGYRRQAFFTQGQQCLFLRCWSEQGRRDFSVGHCAPGPNAFVNCQSLRSLGDSGPIESWASGVLYDNVRIDGAGLALENRWSSPGVAGWSAANCMLWQCQAATMRVFRPPTANNWAVGVWAVFAGDGHFEGRSEFANPASLYQAQLRERIGDDAAARVGPLPEESDGATNPTLEQAAEFIAQSKQPARTLRSTIEENQRAVTEQRRRKSIDVREDTPIATAPPAHAQANKKSSRPAKGLELKNGWLTINGRVVTGGRRSPKWWSGNARPDEAAEFGPAVTRFVPGREGVGLTDDLAHTADWMTSRDVAVLDHNYGLWYDRRRDDHLMVRRANGDCYPPFYEQPFARTGRGKAWDGLSKYDLTRFNPWYWDRLREFAALCDERGLVLMHQNYFQHNILEAGAHWADSPWRPANNVNDTGLPEPPPYIGDKRIFMGPLFYDVTDPRRRELHRNYIRQCLANFTDSTNVLQLTSAEYTGPLEFMQFWLDVIDEWASEHAATPLVTLSAPKDVQDAILADPRRAAQVKVIDIRYWAYTADDGLYAPRGGLPLAPRQHLRQTRQKPGGAAAIVKAVREYREKYPDKAVTYYADSNCPSVHDGWAVLIGGGSLADVRLPSQLAESLPGMRPVDGVVGGGQAWCLGSDGGELLIYSTADRDLALELRPPHGHSTYAVTWIDAKSGEATVGDPVRVEGTRLQIERKTPVLWLTPVAR